MCDAMEFGFQRLLVDYLPPVAAPLTPASLARAVRLENEFSVTSTVLTVVTPILLHSNEALQAPLSSFPS